MKRSQLKKIVKSIIFEVLNNEAFRFRDFDWLKNKEGFGIPTDVYWDAIYLGTIQSTQDGDHYKILLIDTPTGKKEVEQDNKYNKFKSKNLAANALYNTWKVLRKKGFAKI